METFWLKGDENGKAATDNHGSGVEPAV